MLSICLSHKQSLYRFLLTHRNVNEDAILQDVYELHEIIITNEKVLQRNPLSIFIFTSLVI